MAVLTGKGGAVSYNSTDIVGLTNWSVEITGKVKDVPALANAVKRNVVPHIDWKADCTFELPTLTKNAGAIGVGTWAGLDVTDYSFELDMTVEDVVAVFDDWHVYNPVEMNWKFTANRYETSANYAVFCALCAAQAGSLATVAVSCPFGSGTGLIDKADLKADEKAQKGSISVVPALGTAPSAGSQNATLFGYITAAIATVLSQHYADPLALVLPAGSGNAFLTKLSAQGTDANLKGSCSFQGTGALMLV